MCDAIRVKNKYKKDLGHWVFHHQPSEKCAYIYTVVVCKCIKKGGKHVAKGRLKSLVPVFQQHCHRSRPVSNREEKIPLTEANFVLILKQNFLILVPIMTWNLECAGLFFLFIINRTSWGTVENNSISHYKLRRKKKKKVGFYSYSTTAGREIIHGKIPAGTKFIRKK